MINIYNKDIRIDSKYRWISIGISEIRQVGIIGIIFLVRLYNIIIGFSYSLLGSCDSLYNAVK